MPEMRPSDIPSMGESYVHMLEQVHSIKQIFDMIAQAPEGFIVFHCMGGKDRTGLVAMLLLGVAGVGKKDIVSNYEVTYTNLESLRETRTLSSYPSYPKQFCHSSREYIIQAYEHIMQKYESFENYFLVKGIEAEVVHRVKERLIDVEIAAQPH